MYLGRPASSVREEWRCPHRLSGDGQRCGRPRLHSRAVLEHRPQLGGAGFREVPASPRHVLPLDRRGPARDGIVRSGPATPSHGGAGGRHAQRVGRHGLAVGRILRVLAGGPIALLFAATHPERTRAVVLYATYATPAWHKD